LRLALLLLAMPAGVLSLAQNVPVGSGSIDGKLTDLYSKPLAGARVVLRSVSTGAEFEVVTGRNGAYRLAGLAPGAYVLEARTASRDGHLSAGRSSGIVVMPGHAARVQTAIAVDGQTTAAWQAARTIWLGEPTIAAAPVEAAAAQKPAGSLQVNPDVASVKALPGNVPLARGSTAAPSGSVSETAEVTLVEAAPLTTVPTPSRDRPDPVATALRGTGMGLGQTAWASLRAGMQMQGPPPRRAEEALSRPEPAASALTTTLTDEELQMLPLSGRGFDAVAMDAPPEAAPVDGEDPKRTGMGARGGGSIDGVDTRMTFEGRSAGRRTTAALLAPGAGEATASTMRMGEPGGEMAEGWGVETHSGDYGNSGRLHGRAFFYDRSGLLDARNPFTQWTKETAQATAGAVPVFTSFPWSPSDRRTRWSLGLGGPLQRNRLFWFASFENQLRDDPAVAAMKHADNFFAQPTNDEMQVLSARLGLGSDDPVSEGLAAYSTMLETLAGLLGPTPRTSTENAAFVRVDWKATEQHHFTLEATGAHWDAPGGGLDRAAENYGSHSFGASRGSNNWLLGRWEAFLTPNLLAVTQGSLGRHILTRGAETPSAFEQTLNVNPWGQLPQMAVDSGYGFTIGNPARFGSGSYPDERVYQGREDVEWLHGSFAVHSGFGLRYAQDSTSFVRNHTGTYHYARVENFISDALVFAQFGLPTLYSASDEHNCDERGKAWNDTDGQLHGLGYLPCYSYYTQTLGPTEWHLETTDLDSFTTAQWKPRKSLLMSAGLRWELQKMPPPIALVNNPGLPLAGTVPSLGNEWAPHVGMAWGTHESHWPMLRLGYGMVYSRTPNSVLETALTQTGSLNGDSTLFIRPADGLDHDSGRSDAPIFPDVPVGNPGHHRPDLMLEPTWRQLSGSSVKPGAVEVAQTFRNGEVHQGVATLEEELPGRTLVSVSALATLGRRLPITVDTNFDPALNPGTITYDVVDTTGKGPIKAPQITVPFFASWPTDGVIGGRLNPNYQQITQMMSRANSTYEAAMLRVSRAGRRGLSFNARYTYAHAMDWNPDEGALRERASVLDPLDFQQEYGTSNLDLRHSASGYVTWQSPWKLSGAAAPLANGWMVSGMGQYHSGLPYTMRTEGSLAEEFGSGGLVVALGPGMNGYGGANRVYGVGRNTYRYPATWKADMRVGKRFALGHERELELLAQSFNLFNHQNVTELETVGYYVDAGSTSKSLPRLNFLTGLKTGQTEFGQPLNVNATDSYRERQFEFGIGFRFKHDFEDQ
jgi:hypothetical protein